MQVAAALRLASLARELDQDVAHQLRRNAEEMGAVLPSNILPIDQSQISLVDQCRGLQGVVAAFARHPAFSQPVQFAINERG